MLTEYVRHSNSQPSIARPHGARRPRAERTLQSLSATADTPPKPHSKLNIPKSLDAVYARAARHASGALARRHGLRPALALGECEAASDADSDA